MTFAVSVVLPDLDERRAVMAALRDLDATLRAFESGRAFVDSPHAGSTGCLVADVDHEQGLSVDDYLRLARGPGRLPAILVSDRLESQFAVAAMKAGAVDVVGRPFRAADLAADVGRIVAGLRVAADREVLHDELDRRLGTLTLRERETLASILAGEPNKSIAQRIGITERAVEMRRARMMRKLGVDNVAQLVEAVVTHRFLAESHPPPRR